MRWLFAIFLMLPGQGRAIEICDDLWFTRNLLYHRAGHCFGSTLGKAVFGNTGCKADGATPDTEAVKLIETLRALEAEFSCDVDVKQEFLAVPLFEQRKGLVDLPIASEFESACFGWKGPPLKLRDARRPDAKVSGTAQDGDTLLFQFEDVDDWSFIVVQQAGIPTGLGWARVVLDESNCERPAG